jgi:integrase
VFCSQVGRLPGPSLCPLVGFLSRLAKAGLQHVRIHDLLHTYASLLPQQGESLAYIRDQLGHRSIQVTVDIYDHLVSVCNKAVVDRLDDAPLCNLPVTASQIHKVCCCLYS